MADRAKPAATVLATETNPGRMKLWLNKYFPILVLPVLSNSIAANKVG